MTPLRLKKINKIYCLYIGKVYLFIYFWCAVSNTQIMADFVISLQYVLIFTLQRCQLPTHNTEHAPEHVISHSSTGRCVILQKKRKHFKLLNLFSLVFQE